jgi:hypothetical protein
VLISLIAQSFSRLKRRRGAYLSFLSQSAFFFATTRHGWKALTAQQQQIHRVLWSGFCGQVRILWSGQDFVVRSGFCGQVRILWSDGTFTVIRGRENNSDGAGLGLAITERIVRLHGGRIRATNTDGGGLRVEIILPGNKAEYGYSS